MVMVCFYVVFSVKTTFHKSSNTKPLLLLAIFNVFW